MANVIKLKRGSGSDPSASDMVLGEPVLRTDTAELFFKKDNGTVAKVSGGGGSDIFINTLSSSSGSGGGSATFNGSATRFTLSNPPSVSAQQLLVSINGVIQKPNSGTSPSEGFAIDGNDIIFAAAPATGSDFFIVTYGSLNIAVPADNSVTSAKIVDGTIVGTDLATNVDLVDNQKIRFGTGNDTEIFHNGNHFRINESAGYIEIQGAYGVLLQKENGTENLLRALSDGTVELYYDNSKKFETTSTGNLFHTSLKGADNADILLGNSDDFQIFHDGSNSYIKEAGTGNVIHEVTDATIEFKKGGSEHLAKFIPDGAVELYHDNSKKLDTYSGGVNIYGNIDMPSGGISIRDSQKFIAGTGDDLQIYHDPQYGHSFIKESGSGGLIIGASTFEVYNAGISEKIISANADGGVELYYDFSKKLEVFTWGVEINGDLGLDDNRKLALGNGPDFIFYHDGTSNIITSMNGNFFLQASSGENGITINKNGNVKLYHDNSLKFETTSSGATVTGSLGIGTTNPLNKLAINYTVSSSVPGGGIRLQDDTNTTVTTLETTVSSYNYAGVSGHHSLLYGSRDIAIAADGATNGVIKLFAGNAERMRVHNNQFTSFGTGGDTIIYNHSLSDSYVGGVVLDGLGSIQVARHNDQCLLLNRMGPDGTIQTFYNDGTCVGFISVSGSTTAYSTNCSDRTLKKNFEDWTENTLSYFKNIKPQKFNFITEEDTVDKTKGYVAQDLVDNFPEAYPKNDEGKYVFNPSGMVVYLMKALQEAVVRIEALEAG